MKRAGKEERDKTLVLKGPIPIEIDPDRITEWAAEAWRWPDISAELEISERTLRRYKAVNPLLDRAYQKGVARMHQSLRSKQYKLAMAGNVTMLIWLGKNELEQSDKKDLRSLHLHANVSADSQDALSALDTGELKERLAVLQEMQVLEDGTIDIEVEEDVPSLSRGE